MRVEQNNNNIIYVPPRGPRKSTKAERAAAAAFELRQALGCGDRQRVEDALLTFGIDNEGLRKNMASSLLERWKHGVAETAEEDAWPPLCEKDAELIGGMSGGLTPPEACLLSAMARCARARPHPTGRIRYDDDELMRESRIKERGKYRAAFASLVEKGLVKAAVVGSKNPVTTIELPWLPKEACLANHSVDDTMRDADGNPIESPKEGE